MFFFFHFELRSDLHILHLHLKTNIFYTLPWTIPPCFSPDLLSVVLVRQLLKTNVGNNIKKCIFFVLFFCIKEKNTFSANYPLQ